METMILLNAADRDEGFFLFSTTEKADRDRFVARIGQDMVLEEKVSNVRGAPGHWSLKIKSDAFSKRLFAAVPASRREKRGDPTRMAHLKKFQFRKRGSAAA